MQPVRDENDGDALLGHGPDRAEKRFRFLLGQDGRRLVQNQQFQVVLAEFTGNFGKLLMTDGHFTDTHAFVDLEAHFVNGGFRTPGHFVVIESVQTLAEDLGDHVAFFRFTVEKNVLCGGEARNQGELLMDHADPGGQRIERCREADRIPVQQNLTLIAASFPDHVHTKKDFHERALSGAVFAAETEHFTLGQRQVDVGQNLVAEEILFDVAHFQ